jgi:hypothetical protein
MNIKLPPLPPGIFTDDQMQAYATAAVRAAEARHAEELLAYEVTVGNLRQSRGEPVAWVETAMKLAGNLWNAPPGRAADFATDALYDYLQSVATPPAHTEAEVTLILDAFDNIELRRALAKEVRRILGVSK